MKFTYFFIVLITIISCGTGKKSIKTSNARHFDWNNAIVYFLLTDRFYNGDQTNDFKHPIPPSPYRGFMGGDIKGITAKINEGYFEKLGVDVIWMTPLVENISEGVDEGTGLSYGFHGYWTKDWTKIDDRLGNEQDVKQMVTAAHKKGIRVLMDAVVNHTGPVTPSDTQWPEDWVKTGPNCTYQNYETTVNCTLVKNLPDVKTESKQEVMLPPHLIEKWKKEGRYEKEISELEDFFKKTGYPRRPYYYIIKWLTDLIRDYGIDGFRVDTVKHTEEEVWKTLYEESVRAFSEWKKANAEGVLDDQSFYMVGEVYNYSIGGGRLFDFGDQKVDYFSNGFSSLINFDFKQDAHKSYDALFTKYDTLLHTALLGKSVMNYISSHDDGGPYDKNRLKSFESASKLLLTPGVAQIYYGDESARSLSVQASGDAVLRSFMNWDEQKLIKQKEILNHWCRIGQYRRNHPSIGAGRNFNIGKNTFARVYKSNKYEDITVFALDQPKGIKVLDVKGYFKNGDLVTDVYSTVAAKVINGKVIINSPYDIVLLEKNASDKY